MSIAIFTRNAKHSTRWKGILQKELPNHRVEVYPEVEDTDAVQFLLCWKPEPGLIAKFPNLRVIQSLGAGVDHIFESHTIDPSITVSKIADHQLTHDMWEHVLSIVLLDMKNIPLYQKQQEDKVWKPKRYKRFHEVTIGILGLGVIGSYTARQFASLGFRVCGWSRNEKQIEHVESFIGQEGLENICQRSDYLVNILPLTKATEGILSHDLFSKMKSSAFLINVGRGKHLIEDDLISCLNSDELRGASLDVFVEEPLPESHPFWTDSRILITPHIASLTYMDTVYPQIVENIKRMESNQPLLNMVSTENGY